MQPQSADPETVSPGVRSLGSRDPSRPVVFVVSSSASGRLTRQMRRHRCRHPQSVAGPCRTGPGLTNTSHSQNGSPATRSAGSTWELGEAGSARHTGMPELVLMPAPVTTTTLRAFQSAFAISCNNGSQPGSTWVVGIVLRQSIEAALGEGGPRHRRTRQRTATKNKSASVYRVIVRAERW